ncbi:hypothetical protein [Kribbella sp. DT2]|uniref:hypothetical protein n=1 Tax=Kribbella sp. DT2 TaxID=3393427 RepID=UPI003CF94BC5
MPHFLIRSLPDLDAVSRYIENEPYQHAGAYRSHQVWHFDDVLGRTMGDTVHRADRVRYFVLVAEDHAAPASPKHAEHSWSTAEGLVVFGQLRAPHTGSPRGVALAAQVPSRRHLDVVLEQTIGAPAAGDDLEVIDWDFSGRR